MSHWDGHPGKKLAAALFIALYVLPLTGLFLLSVGVIFRPWPARLILVAGFGLPLVALWVSALRYPFFEKGCPPFAWSDRRTRLWLFLLLQGVLCVTLTIVAPFVAKGLQDGGFGVGHAIVFVVGCSGIPAAVFAAGVLWKAWKERGSAGG